MAKATSELHPHSPKLNRRRVLAGAAALASVHYRDTETRHLGHSVNIGMEVYAACGSASPLSGRRPSAS